MPTPTPEQPDTTTGAGPRDAIGRSAVVAALLAERQAIQPALDILAALLDEREAVWPVLAAALTLVDDPSREHVAALTAAVRAVPEHIRRRLEHPDSL